MQLSSTIIMATINKSQKCIHYRLSMVSQNLHGYTQGIAGISELMNISSSDIIFIQEYWLT